MKTITIPTDDMKDLIKGSIEDYLINTVYDISNVDERSYSMFIFYQNHYPIYIYDIMI